MLTVVLELIWGLWRGGCDFIESRVGWAGSCVVPGSLAVPSLFHLASMLWCVSPRCLGPKLQSATVSPWVNGLETLCALVGRNVSLGGARRKPNQKTRDRRRWWVNKKPLVGAREDGRKSNESVAKLRRSLLLSNNAQ